MHRMCLCQEKGIPDLGNSMNKAIDIGFCVSLCISADMKGCEGGVLTEGSKQRTGPGQNCWEYAGIDTKFIELNKQGLQLWAEHFGGGLQVSVTV